MYLLLEYDILFQLMLYSLEQEVSELLSFRTLSIVRKLGLFPSSAE
jgi:hypothetical protein